ncbi:unnamed protein product [Larinioides sclopetarius]
MTNLVPSCLYFPAMPTSAAYGLYQKESVEQKTPTNNDEDEGTDGSSNNFILLCRRILNVILSLLFIFIVNL